MVGINTKDITVDDIFNKNAIRNRAIDNWNFKDSKFKIKSGKKYGHIFREHNLPMNNWDNMFDCLTIQQQRILLHGEVIRTYDQLPVSDKKILFQRLKLSEFENKWYKLNSQDKKKLMKFVM